MKHDLEGYNGYHHVINVEQVFNAIHKLKKEKSDSSKGLWSNHLIYAPHIFKVHIALLLTSMLITKYADKLKTSIFNSLLKANTQL